MTRTNRSKGVSRPSIPLLALLLAALPLASASAQTASGQGSAYSIIDQGAFYRVWQSAGPVISAANGQVLQGIQSYTELGDGLCYFAGGQWLPAQDIIAITPTGAAAVQGQLKAAFSGDITAPGAIALTTASGLVFQSHPLGLYYSDSASGLVAQIGSVQPSTGLLYAPNVLVFTNVLSGLNADLLLVWAKEGFEQNLVLKQAPPAPASFGLSNATSRLQFWTAMDACPQPVRQQAVRLRTGLVDNRLFYPDCWFPVGSAFVFGETPLPPEGQAARVRQFDPADPNAIPTAKSLVTVGGQQVLIEEINYTDLAAAFGSLSQAALPSAGRDAVQLAARGQLLPATARAERQSPPIQAASGPYQARGVVLDYTELTGTTNAFTFISSNTYCISNWFSVHTGGATFQSGSFVKFATNASLDLNCPVYTPTNAAAAVLTSVDDNGFGAVIQNATGNPNYAASYAIIMDYNDLPNMPLTNLLVRWAQYGIAWEEDQGYNGSVSFCAFQNCQTALWVDNYEDTLYLSNNVSCNVSNQVYLLSGTVSGSNNTISVAMVDTPSQDTGDMNQNADTNKNTHSECSFILANNSQTIVAAWADTHLDVPGHGELAILTNIVPRATSWAMSTNGGVSFTNTTPLPPYGINLTNFWQGDCPNVTMAYDPNYPSNSQGTVYLLGNCARQAATWYGPRLWISTNLGMGSNFVLINTNVPGARGGTNIAIGSDRPMIKVNTMTHDVFVAVDCNSTPAVCVARSTNGGVSWGFCQMLDTGEYPDIVTVPSGVAYVTGVESGWRTNNGAGYFSAWLTCVWLLPGSSAWSGPTNLGITLNGLPQRRLFRFRQDSTNDYFVTSVLARTAFANGHVYIVYSDLPTNSLTTGDRGDIFLAEFATNQDGSLSNTWGPITVNNDRSYTDQWDPAIAAKPGGTKLFIGYYSRQNDPASNSLIMAYGATCDVSNGLSNAAFECFPISTTAFPPLFDGTNDIANMQFDPLLPAETNLCLDVYGRICCVYTRSPPPSLGGCPAGDSVFDNAAPLIPTWFQDDNTWADADTNYFYYAWSDRSGTYTNNFWWTWGSTNSWPTNSNSRPFSDVKFAIIKQ